MAIKDHECTYDADGAACPICGQTVSEGLYDEQQVLRAATALAYNEGYNLTHAHHVKTPLEIAATNKRAYDEGVRDGYAKLKATYQNQLDRVLKSSIELNRLLDELCRLR
jgi:hypothetical protein